MKSFLIAASLAAPLALVACNSTDGADASSTSSTAAPTESTAAKGMVVLKMTGMT